MDQTWCGILRHNLKSLRKSWVLCDLLYLKDKKASFVERSYFTTSGRFGRQTNKMPNSTSIQAYELFTSRKSLNKHSRFFSLLRAIFCYISKTALKPDLDSQLGENSHASKIGCCHISILLSITIVIVNKIPQLSPFMALWFRSQDRFVVTRVASSLLLTGG